MALTTEKYREGLTNKVSFLISSIARNDKKVFTIEDAKAIAGEQAIKMLINLVKKKWILKLKRGLYIIVPLDIGVKGADSFIMHNFVIASKLVKPYYIGYWSALNYYGFSDQIPSTTFIATTKAKKGLKILDTSYLFVQVSKSKFFGTTDIEIEGEKVKISDKNKTIADCLDHSEHGGGIDEIARSICSMDFNKGKVQKLFKKKCEIKGIQFKGIEKILPDNIESTLMPYWNQELGRLLNPLPDIQYLLNELKSKLGFLES